ncbi:hypothetical protein HKCCE2091_19900 [Rhodobacterales bacterium HKCCE2091]|nr:hypothetical protein [Rhodobacterales bacterium HKCCE2091]
MTADTPIRTRRDGSIDTAHYIARSRALRARAARDATGRLARAAIGGAAVIATLALLPAMF